MTCPLEELLRAGSPRPITRWDDPAAHLPCLPVTEYGPDLWNLVCDMSAPNTAANGAGLAAPQIGVDLAVFGYDCDDAFGRREPGLVCNPQVLLAAEPHDVILEEGCLPLPGAYTPVGSS